MQTMESLGGQPGVALSSPAAERNTAPILAQLRAALPDRARVLEIASGSGQHAVAFATALPHATWQPSDPSARALASIEAWREDAALPNILAPRHVDAADPAGWPEGPFDAVVCINMIHISPWSATEGLMAGAARVLAPDGRLFLYGPFREAEVPLAPSNAAFDADLKARDAAWGLRDRDEVVRTARDHGLALLRRTEMPANNLSLLFRRSPDQGARPQRMARRSKAGGR